MRIDKAVSTGNGSDGIGWWWWTSVLVMVETDIDRTLDCVSWIGMIN